MYNHKFIYIFVRNVSLSLLEILGIHSRSRRRLRHASVLTSVHLVTLSRIRLILRFELAVLSSRGLGPGRHCNYALLLYLILRNLLSRLLLTLCHAGSWGKGSLSLGAHLLDSCSTSYLVGFYSQWTCPFLVDPSLDFCLSRTFLESYFSLGSCFFPLSFRPSLRFSPYLGFCLYSCFYSLSCSLHSCFLSLPCLWAAWLWEISWDLLLESMYFRVDRAH